MRKIDKNTRPPKGTRSGKQLFFFRIRLFSPNRMYGVTLPTDSLNCRNIAIFRSCAYFTDTYQGSRLIRRKTYIQTICDSGLKS